MSDVEEHIQQLRTICLGFPDAIERETWGHPTFRVRDKIFVGAGVDDSGQATMSAKAAAGEQEVLLEVGHPFFYPKYVGSKGWIGVMLDDGTDWSEIAELVEDSYREIAPKTLVRRLDE